MGESFTHIYCYIDSIIYTVQGSTKIQHPLFYFTVCALKWIFSSLPGESNDTVSAKKSCWGRATRTASRKSWDGPLTGRREKQPSWSTIFGNSLPCGHLDDSTLHGTKGSRALVLEAPLHAPRSTRGGDTPVPKSTRYTPGGGVQVLAVAVLSSINYGLDGPSSASGSPDHAPG